jgi:hypothetical protein
MWLALIEPAQPGEDKLVFECTACRREEFVVVRINDVPRLEMCEVASQARTSRLGSERETVTGAPIAGDCSSC